MSEVAGSLGVATSALYHHVQSAVHLQLLFAVHSTERLADRLRDSLVATAGSEAINSIARTYRSFAEEFPGQFEAAMWPPVSATRVDDLAAAHRRIIDLFIEAARSAGADDDVAVHRGRLLRSAVHGFVAIEVIDGFVHDADRDATFDHLIDATAGLMAA